MFKTFTLVICYLTHVIQSDRSRDLKSSKDGNGISFDLYGDIYNSEIPENSNYIPATIISDINSNSASVACGILCEEGYCVNEHCKKCVINSDLILETDQSISNICLCKRGFFLSENSRCEKCGELCSECNNQVCLECIDKSILIPDPFNPRSCMCHNQGAFINDLCLTNPPRRLLCDSSCSTCLGSTPNDCLICSVSLIVPLSVPNSCTCATNEYMTVQNPKTCVSCYSACASCNGISDSSCTSCVDPSRTPGSGRCDCLTDQYYLDTINISCGDCHIDCATCSGPDMTDCDSCQDPSRILGSSPSKCTCDTNEFIESYNPFTCTACDPSCSTCSGPLNTDCLTCTNSLIFPATTPGLCECESNQFISNYNTLVCENCGYGCATCQGSGRYDCLSCIDPQLEMTLAVDSCECSAGFYLSSYNPVTCQPCYEACYKCNGPSATDCTECSLPYFINIAGRCDCPYGSYISIYNPVTCGICHGTCASCVGPNYDDCNTCATQGYVLGITPGPCSCLTGNYVASIDVFSCLPCDQTCKECSGGLDTECTSCADQNILGPDISGKCYCLSNQFINGYQPLECLDCHSSCATCSGSTLYDCLTCADQDVVILAPNRCSCIDGKYPIDLSPLTCLDCDSSCKTCKGSGKDECLTCKDNDMVQSISPGKCDCDAGQYIHNKNPLECFNCHNSCYSCDGQSDTDCIICKDSEISISESSHNCSCADDQFISNKRPLECAQCSNNCKRCSSDTTCTSCHSPKILYNGDCVCPDDHVMIDNQCLACESNCKKCGISPSDCTSCQEPFILLYSSCVCPK